MEAMVRRMLAALARRGAAGEVEALEALANLERVVPDYLGQAARGAHDGPAGYSWTDLGLWLGISRQAARQRFSSGGSPDGD